MPPPSGQKGSQKGTGKKGGAGVMRQHQHNPRSRNTTPSAGSPQVASLPPIEQHETATLDVRFDLFRNITYDDIVDHVANNAASPDSKSLDGLLSRLSRLSEVIDKRGANCDKGMRLLAQSRRLRESELAAERGREEERRQKEADEEERAERKANKKKRKATENLAPPQGNNIESSSPVRESGNKARKLSRDDSASSSLSPVAPRTPSAMEADDKTKTEENDDDDSDDDGQPPPPARPQANTFGDDPSTFPDPTVYEILPVKPGMTEDEIKEIYSVAVYPKSDLADIIAGDPPDKDFSSAKPSNQINFSTFSTYVEPFFRPFTEEDLAFLRERGDRVTPFVMPKRGKKHYTEIWAEEDGAMAIDSADVEDKLPPNQPRGNIENMNDEIAETDKLSVGPILARLLQTMRPEHRAPPAEERQNGATADGDVAMNGVDRFDFGDTQPQTALPTVNGINGTNGNVNGTTGQSASNQLPPATFMPESSSESWKKASHPKLDYSQVDERLKQELRHIGFLSFPPDQANGTNSISNNVSSSNTGNHNMSSTAGSSTSHPSGGDPGPTAADFDGHYDDEVAARLRLLQARLHEQVLLNGARKARLTDLVKERMAFQEYQTILEDLDSQVQAAYLKRTRTMGKKPKKARPGAAKDGANANGGSGTPGPGGAAGMARPGIGDLTRTLMERRRRWIENMGPLFEDDVPSSEDMSPAARRIRGSKLMKVPRVNEEGSTIFPREAMADLIKREKDSWDDEEADEE
ncbi:histone acetyltransferases subunit 3-domain-containing protein [Pseudoneurospora amorphoporcata]|uniref:Histone acetyltransferases subunit 3-domain-containing protein n=1 Tax=Pseudoneurospora amorphoporcata TaxID=241081 RepID=A0AAN6NU35_9PEZI|nr:histone acetyltransferases subunit 3-domain-containing protein [Pseudoneurospora amorphoporcata]